MCCTLISFLIQSNQMKFASFSCYTENQVFSQEDRHDKTVIELRRAHRFDAYTRRMLRQISLKDLLFTSRLKTSKGRQLLTIPVMDLMRILLPIPILWMANTGKRFVLQLWGLIV